MKLKLFCTCLIIYALTACKENYSTTKIEGKRLSISDSLETSVVIEDFIKPYRERVNRDLDSTLAYSKETYSKNDGELNTAIGNFMADAVKELSNPILKKRTGESIDLALLNHGGIRSIISKGNVTSRTAYEVMPFDNEVVVTPMKADQIRQMLDYLSSSKRAHPISGLELKLNEDYSIANFKINGVEFDENRTYFLATSDYLYNGGDRMQFLKSKDSAYFLDYKIRNLLIDYFKKVDTLQPVIDNRFIRDQKDY